MKYTRYDVKPKKKNDDWKTTLMMICGVVILALAIGTLISMKLFPKEGKVAGEKETQTQVSKTNENKTNNNQPNKDSDVPPVVPEESKPKETSEKPTGASTAQATTYTVVQCGYFSTKESAQAVKSEIGSRAKILAEGDKFRVVCYIGSEEEAQKLSDKFTKDNIENTKARFSLPAESATDKSIIQMINGILDISNKLNETDVASVKSDEFKTWTNALKENKDDSKYSNFSKIKTMINELSAEVTIEESVKIYQVIYDILSTYK